MTALLPDAIDRPRAVRRLTTGQADELLGCRVPDLEPNVTRPTIAVDDDGAPVWAYLPGPDRATGLRRAVRSMKMTTTYRDNGINNVSRTFGYSPRRPMRRRDGCGVQSADRDHPQAVAELGRWARLCADQYAAFHPDRAQADRQTMGQVGGDWRLGGDGLWTSGIVNESTSLPYHRDNANFHTWSAMPVVRRGTRGGYLHLPEYGAVLPCRDGWVVHFCGRELVHGVTPITKTADDGYRYSVVFYAIRGMANCADVAAEQTRARTVRTQRERDLAQRLATGDTAIPNRSTSRPKKVER